MLMTNELERPSGMRFIGLLTHTQKQAGYFVSQDEDFVWLWKEKDNKPDIVAVFLYENATIKQVREECQKHLSSVIGESK